MAAYIPAAIAAAGSVASSYLANKGAGQQTKMEKTKGKLVDQLLNSLNGNGPFNDLFNTDDAAFQKSFVEPAQSRFRNQTAPMIQQAYIQGGQQRNTALDDTLTRAGVDMDSILNSQYLGYQQQQQQNSLGAIGNILNQGQGTAPGLSTGNALAQGGAGYLSSTGFSDLFKAGGPFGPAQGGGAGAAAQPASLGGGAPQIARPGFNNQSSNWVSFAGTQ